MKSMGIFLLISSQIFAACEVAIYEPCAKTYVDPFLVELYQNKIKVARNGEIVCTSALFSDAEGLYYKDFLVEKKKEKVPTDLTVLFDEEFFLFNSDELVDACSPLEESTPNDLITSDQGIVDTAPQLELKIAEECPNKQQLNSTITPQSIWPYCDKIR